MLKETEDRSVEDENGKIIFFSAERFVRDICRGGCCFICGAQPGSKPFNDEHIFPEWLLRRFTLFDKLITLPNGAKIRYDRYTVPCCAECNALLGRVVEATISRVVSNGAQDVSEFIEHGGALWLITWLGLIYFKTHLKDSLVRFHLDKRNGPEKISDAAEYEWGRLHHLHCLVRHFYTGCKVMPEALGSLFVAPTNMQGSVTSFDYADLTIAQSVMMRLGDIGLVAVFDDSGAAMSRFYPVAKKITGSLSGLQLREVHVEMSWLNLHLAERTSFHTVKDHHDNCYIVGKRGSLKLNDLDLSIRGDMLHRALFSHGADITMPGFETREAAEKVVKTGRYTFLFDDAGGFIKQTML